MKKALLSGAVLLALSSFSLVGCAAKYDIQAADPAQSSDVHILVAKTKTGGYQVDIDMEHLTPPDRLGDYSAYIAWFIVEGEAPVKAGQIDYNEKKRNGLLTATTPARNFNVVITLEADGTATVPSATAVVDQRVTGPK